MTSPRSSDMMAALAEIEAAYPVLDWRVGDLAIWPLTRVRWMFSQWTSHYVSAGASFISSAMARVKRLSTGPAQALRASLEDGGLLFDRPSACDLLFLSDGVSFAKLGDKWFERFCDPLMAAGNRRGLRSVMLTPTHRYQIPRGTPSHFIQPAIDRANVLGALRARIAPPHVKLPQLDDVRAAARRKGLDSDSLSRGSIVSDACRVEALTPMYGALLGRTQPKAAFVVGFYNVEGMAFVRACRARRVPVVDLQHGVQGDMHPAYAAWPRTTGHMHDLVPDVFWTWSDWETSVIDGWASGSGHRGFAGGNPWMSLVDNEGDWPGMKEAVARAVQLRAEEQPRPVVLVTLQPVSPAEQLEPLVRLIQTSADKLAIWARLHPGMAEDNGGIKAALARAGRCRVEEPSELPLQALLRNVDVHMTHSSSTVIEAAQFGVSSVVTSEYGEELFGPLYARGVVTTETGDVHRLTSKLVETAHVARGLSSRGPSMDQSLGALLDVVKGRTA